MLLKIMTNTHTTKIVTNIVDVEIHNIPIRFLTVDEAFKSAIGLPHPAHGNFSVDPICYDRLEELSNFVLPDSDEQGTVEQVAWVIDFMKNEVWQRLLVLGFGYLCNDDGKTISKIGC